MSSFGLKRWDHRANVGSLPAMARLGGFAEVNDFDDLTATHFELDFMVRLSPAAWKAAREGMPITITLSDP